jgi:AraC-like DNA-binding protein
VSIRFRKYTPGAPLSALVDCLWYWEGAPQTHSKERLLPNGESAIIFNLRDDPIRIYDAQDLRRSESYGHAVFSGARSNCFVIDTPQEERVVGVQFLPGGAFPFFHVPLSESEDISVNLEDLWSRRTGEIREQLLAAPTVESMLFKLEECLLAQLVRPPELHPAVGVALGHLQRSLHNGRVADVSERVGLSSRRFIELFHRQIGLTPKVFCRVRRFQQVLRTIHRKTDVDWAQIALECGYYDQPHFIHDFRSFSGLTPGGYLAAATPHLNHVPLI